MGMDDEIWGGENREIAGLSLPARHNSLAKAGGSIRAGMPTEREPASQPKRREATTAVTIPARPTRAQAVQPPLSSQFEQKCPIHAVFVAASGAISITGETDTPFGTGGETLAAALCPSWK